MGSMGLMAAIVLSRDRFPQLSWNAELLDRITTDEFGGWLYDCLKQGQVEQYLHLDALRIAAKSIQNLVDGCIVIPCDAALLICPIKT